MSENRDDQVVTRGGDPSPKGPQNAKERVYEKLRMPLWVLDIILGLLVAALVVALVLGILHGNSGA